MIDHQAVRERALDGLRFAPETGTREDEKKLREAYRKEQQRTSAPAVRKPVRHERVAWREKAACRDAPKEVFYPDHEGRGSDQSLYDDALAVCATCPVLSDCHAFVSSIEGYDSYGVWAGMTPREREAIHRGRPRPKPAPKPEDRCGTLGGYVKHVEASQVPCGICRKAWRQARRAEEAR